MRQVTPEGQCLEDLIKKYNVPKFVVDIGARLAGSNSVSLIEKLGFKATLADMNPRNARDLRDYFAKYKETTVLERKVEPKDMVDLVPPDCGVLCIDVDGNDYHLWKSVTSSPKIVVIEFAGRDIPKDVPYVSDYDASSKKRWNGANDLALIELAATKGYRLFKKISVNLIFLHRSLDETFLHTSA